MTAGIYLIENIASPLFYIGQSSNIDRRFVQHRSLLNATLYNERGKRRANRRLWLSWNKHGESSFRFSVIEECATGVMTEREYFWLCHYKGAYPGQVCNCEGPVDNPMRGGRHTPETLSKISASLRGLIRTEETRARMSASQKGKIISPETRAKIRASRVGSPSPAIRGAANPSHRPEHKARMYGANNPVHTPGVAERIALANSKGVVDLASGETWLSMSACAATLGCTVAAVSSHLKGVMKSCKGRRLSLLIDSFGESKLSRAV